GTSEVGRPPASKDARTPAIGRRGSPQHPVEVRRSLPPEPIHAMATSAKARPRVPRGWSRNLGPSGHRSAGESSAVHAPELPHIPLRGIDASAKSARAALADVDGPRPEVSRG